MSQRNNHLFAGKFLSDFLNERQESMRAEISGYPRDYLLKASLDDLADHLGDKYRIELVALAPTEISEYGETQLDASGDPMRDAGFRNGPIYIKARYTVFAIPFTGDSEILYCRPPTFNTNPPCAEVSASEIRIRLTRTDHDAEAMRKEFDSTRAQIQQNLDRGAEMINRVNSILRQSAKNHLENRKRTLLDDQGMVASLGFPIRERPDATKTYTAPITRKKLPVAVPSVPSGPFQPEPVLEMGHYEHILAVISNMVSVMERSPATFSRLDEEALRTHILVQLNGHYEGKATAETFNSHGKTDILIRDEGKNIFIAECKFWKGAEHFKQATDQLLGYAAWRDIKTALIIFNRNKDTSAVLSQIPSLVAAHPNFKRPVADYKHETSFRFILHHRDDKNRELTLTVLVFDVPSGGVL